MTYSANSLIEATDYNTLVGAYNTLWGTGLGSTGLGQTTTLSEVLQESSVLNTEWKNLAAGITNLGVFQGSVVASLPAFNKGDLIAYVAGLQTSLTTLNANKGSAAEQGTMIVNSTETTSSWSNSLTFTQTVTFASGDSARYFFNAGGQIVIQPSMVNSNQATGSVFFNRLATQCGSWVISGLGGKIVGTTYTPFTKLGGRSNVSPSNINTTLGYYNLTTNYQEAVKIFSDDTFGGAYSSGSYINLSIKTDGPDGINNDNGSTLTFRIVFDEVPNGLTVSGTTKVSCFVKPPRNLYIRNTWGNISFAGTVTGS
jgi:hypothetical protein